MQIDHELVSRFEVGLDPQQPSASAVPAALIGYGEISAIFAIAGDDAVVYKRMPLFDDVAAARAYEAMYHRYCELLAGAGLCLPDTATTVVAPGGRPVTLYIAQPRLPAARFGHRLVHTQPAQQSRALVELVLAEAHKVWAFNAEHGPELEIAIDGQLSNWVLPAGEGGPEAPPRLLFVDTSTPFIRRHGAHELDPRLILRAAPPLLRWLLEKLFAGEVLERYFDFAKNMIDVTANLYKEQRPELVPVFLEAINARLPAGVPPLSEEGVRSYYRTDKLIWTLFLAARRLDRWITTRLLRRRYEFILPGKIAR